MSTRGKRKKRKKVCRACGKKFGRRSLKCGATFCSGLCREVYVVQKALVGEEVPPVYKLNLYKVNASAAFHATTQASSLQLQKLRQPISHTFTIQNL